MPDTPPSSPHLLIISADGFEESELLEPYRQLSEAGMEVTIASLKSGPITGKHGTEVHASLAADEVEPKEYDLLILPGGRAPAKLREVPAVQAIVRHFFEQELPVAAICHGPQILISAGVMAGRTATAYPSVADELDQAGAHYRDQELVVDGELITSRRPADLPAFIGAIKARLAQA